jgi:hypothetical protein
MGVVVAQNTDKAQVNATMAAVVLDAEGTIVAIDLDVAQSTCPKTDAGVFVTEGSTLEPKPKKALTTAWLLFLLSALNGMLRWLLSKHGLSAKPLNT